MNANFGLAGCFLSNGTRVFISNGAIWDNRIEDPSGWFFTRAGDAYATVRPGGGYVVTTKTYTRSVNKNPNEVEEKNGRYLERNDLWAPVVLQMGQAREYESFEAFQASVKENKFVYRYEKLAYVSEAGETLEYRANSKTLPEINGKPVNLNPEKNFDSPFLSMEHGSNKAVISYPGYKDVVLVFRLKRCNYSG